MERFTGCLLPAAMAVTMFEGGKIKPAVSEANGALRPRELRWTDLVAQLAATRDLRGAASRKAADGAAGRFVSLNADHADTPPWHEGESQDAFRAGDPTDDAECRHKPHSATHRALSKDRDV